MGEERAKTTAMDHGVERLRGELRDAVELIRGSGGGVVFEEFPGALQEEPPPGVLADGTDASPVRVAPDATAAAHRVLIDAADELAETLAQLDATAWRTPPLADPVGHRVDGEVDRRRTIAIGPEPFHNGGALAPRDSPLHGRASNSGDPRVS
jgi:hypothetical protein